MENAARPPARLLDRTALALRDDLAAGRLGAVEAVRAALAAAEEHAGLGAFAALDAERALDRARRLDDERAGRRGAGDAAAGPDHRLGALHGMPTAFKDLTDVAGLPTRRGSELTASSPVPDRHDPVVERLAEAGVVTVGKTTVPEFGLDAHSENPLGGAARTPLDPSRTAGGSSGGSAAAVAAGILPVAPGTDGGGSVRIPAAACGLVGLKPGRGTVPTDPPAESVRNLAVTGPLAHTVADAALLFDALTAQPASPGAGPSLEAVQDAVGRLEAGERPVPLRVGVTAASPFAPELSIGLATSAFAALTTAGARLAGLGHAVDEFVPEYGDEYHRDFRTLWTSGLLRADLPEGAEHRVGPMAANFLHTAGALSAEQIDAAERRMTDWAVGLRAQFAVQDVVMTPVLAFAPPEVGHFTSLEPEANYERQCLFTPYTSMVNVMGLPAVSVPVTRDEDGLSWSVQLIGRPGDETRLLRLAAQLKLAAGADA